MWNWSGYSAVPDPGKSKPDKGLCGGRRLLVDSRSGGGIGLDQRRHISSDEPSPQVTKRGGGFATAEAVDGELGRTCR